RNSRERCINLATRVGVKHPDLQAHRASCRFHVSDNGLCNRSIVWFDEQGNARCPGYQLVQKSQPLCGQFTSQPINPSQIAPGVGEACDKTKCDRVSRSVENNRDCCGCGLSCKCRRSVAGNNYVDLPMNQVSREFRQSINLICRTEFKRDVLMLEISGLL